MLDRVTWYWTGSRYPGIQSPEYRPQNVNKEVNTQSLFSNYFLIFLFLHFYIFIYIFDIYIYSSAQSGAPCVLRVVHARGAHDTHTSTMCEEPDTTVLLFSTLCGLSFVWLDAPTDVTYTCVSLQKIFLNRPYTEKKSMVPRSSVDLNKLHCDQPRTGSQSGHHETWLHLDFVDWRRVEASTTSAVCGGEGGDEGCGGRWWWVCGCGCVGS